MFLSDYLLIKLLFSVYYCFRFISNGIHTKIISSYTLEPSPLCSIIIALFELGNLFMKKLGLHEAIGVVVAIVVVIGFFYFGFPITNNNNDDSSSAAINSLEGALTAEEMGNLKIEDVTVGTGDEALPGTLITVHYTGTLAKGKKFDSSIDRGQPAQFPLGQGFIIRGWEEGLKGMKVGGKRKLTIPPELGYGMEDLKDPAGNVVLDAEENPLIPGNSTLVFEVELLKVEK